MKNLWFSALKRLGASACIFMAAFVGMTGNAHALSCPYGKVEQAGLCYSPARAGYSCTGALCMEDCRSGYSPSVPGFCHYRGALTYTEGPYVTRTSSHPHRCLALFYRNCRDNYSMDVCGICSYKGAWDITRNSYFRAPGISPDFNNAFNLIGSTVQSTYGSAAVAIQGAYYTAVNEIQKFLDALLAKIFRAAGKATLDQGGLGNVLRQTVSTFKAINGDDLNAMKRVLATVASKKQLADGSDELKDVANVMLGLGDKLKLRNNSSLPSNVQNSSYGIFTSTNAAYVAGVNESISIVVNSRPDAEGKYQFSVLLTTGGSVGFAFAAGGDLGFMWNPGTVDKQSGAFVGLTGGGDLGVGVGGALNWGVEKGMRGAQLAIPSVSVAGGVGGGFPLNLSLTGGNTFVLQKFSFKP